jgi:hypothetical protein
MNMESIESLKNRLHDLLIEHEGDVKLANHQEIIREAETLGIDKRQLSKLLQEVDSRINWKYIREQKEKAAAREEALKKALGEQKKREQNAGELLQFIIDQCARDEIFDASEIKLFFNTSDELHQDEHISARLLKDYFEKNNYIPLAMQAGSSIRSTLQSTNWYKDKLPLPPPPAPLPSPSPSPFPRMAFIISAVLIIAITGALGYFFWFKQYVKDKNATRMYSYANSLKLRSSPASGADYNVIDNLPYGTELLVYSLNSNWANCKAREKTGFAATQFILHKKEFHELNSIFADAHTKVAIPTTKCRKALLSYFSQKGIMGKMDIELQRELYGAEQNKEVWQLIAKPQNTNLKTIAYPKAMNPNLASTDFACLIKNVNTGKRRFLLFSFNENEEPVLMIEQDAPDSGYIGKISRANNNLGIPFNVVYVD